MSKFEDAYRSWLQKHITTSHGERLRRLKERHGFGEKCLLQHGWWPVVGSLADLHPEYPFATLNGNHYFMDIAYLRAPKPTCIEADDFGSHARDADRGSFSRGLDRQNEIVLAGWNILRFSLDKLKEKPFECQNHIRRMLLEWYGQDHAALLDLSVYEREIVRLAARTNTSITPRDVSQLLGKSDRFARDHLHNLEKKQLLEAASGTRRKRSYKLFNEGSWFR
ncbi:MAG: DNA-binding response regulator [Paenibacillaceae bacterium]|nr:DNA-binding response regulator [Paenibacillaceae bacterium]